MVKLFGRWIETRTVAVIIFAVVVYSPFIVVPILCGLYIIAIGFALSAYCFVHHMVHRARR